MRRLVLVVLLGVGVRDAEAQICNPPVFAVTVTPKASPVSWMTNTSGHTATVTVKNTGTCTDTYTFTYKAIGPITGVSLNKTSATLAANVSTTVIKL